MTDRKHIDPTIYTTRPTDERLEKENRVYDLLEELNIPFVRIDHDAMNTIDECQDVDRLLGVEICKNLFLCNSQKTKFYLLMMPGRKKFITRDFCKQINSSRLSFAPPEYMKAYLDLTPGSASILGLMNDHEHHVQLVMDQEVVDQPLIGCHPCINTSSLTLSCFPCTSSDFSSLFSNKPRAAICSCNSALRITDVFFTPFAFKISRIWATDNFFS